MDTEQYIQKLFEDSGWYEGRNVKVQTNVLDLFKPAYKNAIRVLKEYGGLTVGEVAPGRDFSASEICFYSKTFDLGKEFDKYWTNINSLFSVASAHRDHMQIVVDEFNNFYIFTDPDEQLYFGGSFQDTVNKVLLGINYGNALSKT